MGVVAMVMVMTRGIRVMRIVWQYLVVVVGGKGV
jgi:hypothetical protein